MVQLSRDARQIETCVSNFLAYEDQITFVSNDIQGDMRLIDYNPFDPAAEGGEKLIRTTEFHKGAEATCSLLLAKPSVRPSSELLLGRAIYSFAHTIADETTQVVSMAHSAA